MAINYTLDTFKIYEDQLNQAYIEQLQQEVNLWNTMSGGTLVLTTESIKGNFQRRAIFQELASANIMKHRDPSSVAAITAETLDQIEQTGVKINRYTFMQKTADAFAKLAMDPEATFSQLVGTATAMAQAEDAINTMIAALTGAISSETNMVMDKSAAAFTYKDFNEARFKFGDKYGRVKALLMHSDTARALGDLAIDEKLQNVGGIAVNTGTWASLGIPVLITDSDELKNGANYNILCLTPEAGVWVDSESPRVYMQPKLDSENTFLQMKRETAANILVKGYTYKGTTISPTNADLKDKANWGKFATDSKNTAGVIMTVKASA